MWTGKGKPADASPSLARRELLRSKLNERRFWHVQPDAETTRLCGTPDGSAEADNRQHGVRFPDATLACP
jgi:hypothetical protein